MISESRSKIGGGGATGPTPYVKKKENLEDKRKITDMMVSRREINPLESIGGEQPADIAVEIGD